MELLRLELALPEGSVIRVGYAVKRVRNIKSDWGFLGSGSGSGPGSRILGFLSDRKNYFSFSVF